MINVERQSVKHQNCQHNTKNRKEIIRAVNFSVNDKFLSFISIYNG